MKTKTQRRDEIIEIAIDCQTLGCGPDAPDNQFLDCVEECTGYRLSMAEERLALVAWQNDEATAKASVWYTW